MFKIGEYVVYGHNGVCQVTEIGPLKTVTKDEGKLYYTLIPYGVKGSTVFAPRRQSEVTIEEDSEPGGGPCSDR